MMNDERNKIWSSSVPGWGMGSSCSNDWMPRSKPHIPILLYFQTVSYYWCLIWVLLHKHVMEVFQAPFVIQFTALSFPFKMTMWLELSSMRIPSLGGAFSTGLTPSKTTYAEPTTRHVEIVPRRIIARRYQSRLYAHSAQTVKLAEIGIPASNLYDFGY